MKNTVAFTGHRPEKLRIPTDVLTRKLDEVIRALHREGFTTFLSGMARGFDMLATQAVLKLRDEYPEIRLVAVIPFMGQELRFSTSERMTYSDILNRADKIVLTSESYHSQAYFVRNDYLLANSSIIVCYYNGEKGGTMYTVNRAKATKLPVINLFCVLSC